jgi:hypothetical protein
VAVALIASAAIRLRLADVPLERDEGEYAYAGQLIRRGVPPYELAYNMKFPGTYYAYALIFSVFGETARGIRSGLILINAGTALLVFLLGRRWFGAPAGAVGALVFATLALDRWTMALFAHATHFLVLPALGGWLLLSPAGPDGLPGRSRSAAAGALVGLSILMKQQAAAFLAAAMVWVIWRRIRAGDGWRPAWFDAGALVAGSLLPLGLVVLVMARQGVLDAFLFWTVEYAGAYVRIVPIHDAWPAFLAGWTQITQATGWLWALAAAGLAALVFARLSTEARVFMLLMTTGSAAALVPGFFFRPHYFIALLPAAGLLAGLASLAIARSVGRLASPRLGDAAAVLVPVTAVSIYAFGERAYLFHLQPNDVSRSVYSVNPFVEAPEIGRYLRERTAPDDRIVVFGSEPEIYFYADRRSATGYIYTYPLMEPQPHAARMQAEMMREIEAARPAYIVGVVVPWSWLVRPDSDRRILTWFDRYARACYEVVGAASITPTGTTLRWDADVAGFTPAPTNTLYVHRRKSNAPCALEPPPP